VEHEVAKVVSGLSWPAGGGADGRGGRGGAGAHRDLRRRGDAGGRRPVDTSVTSSGLLAPTWSAGGDHC